MKRKISILLSIIMIFSMIIPINSFAQDDKGLKEAITIVKTKLNIPDNFTEFKYDIGNNYNKKTWYLRWSSNNEEDGTIEASVDEDGMIVNYYHYKPYKKIEKKLPSLTKEEAKKASDDFIKNIDKDLLGQLKYIDDNKNDIKSNIYYFNYVRLVNNIPFYDNGVRIEVNKETGEVRSYTCNWTKDISFPNSKDIISLKEAQNKYAKELGLKLIYRSNYNNKKIEPYLVYTTKYGTNYGIDAFTGKRTKISPPIIYYRNNDEAKGAELEDKYSVQLNPQELEAVEKVSKLISKEEAEDIAKNFDILGLNSDFKLKNSHLNKRWTDDSKFEWNLNFEYEKKHVNISIDALNGEIVGFNIYGDYDANSEAKYDKEDGKKAAEEFLKEFYSKKYESIKYDDTYEDFYHIQEDKKPKYYNFKFNRIVNGVEYEDNYLTVGYDAVTGKVNSFYSRWYNIEFPKVSNIIELDKAYDVLFNKIGLELQYKLDYDYKQGNENKSIKLVYVLNNNIPNNIQADDGQIIYYNKKPYLEVKKEEYKDIKNHYAKKEINSLKEFGIGFDEELFKPDQKITQLEFLKLYIKTVDFYEGSSSEEEYIDNMYSYLIREGILKKEEVKPDSIITKQDALKIMINGLGYSDVAQINKIFNCPFKDVDDEFKGYASIGYGLKIVSGYNGLLNGNKELTRAEAAVMIYNYLSR